MKVAIMQPYFMPYIGYFQLISAVDLFIVYDNIKYTKKGWINRNRMLLNGSDTVFSLPIKSDSDSLCVVQRRLSPDFERSKLLARFRGAYQRAPYFSETYPLLERIVSFEDDNLFEYIFHSLTETCRHLDLKAQMRVSSTVAIDHGLKAQEKVLMICKAVGAQTYVNPRGGVELYELEAFASRGIDLTFLVPDAFTYDQFGSSFVPWLSIIDVLMFNSLDVVKTFLERGYTLSSSEIRK